MVDDVKKKQLKPKIQTMLFFQALSKEKNFQKRVRKKGLRYISHPKMKNFRANSYSSDMTQIS